MPTQLSRSALDAKIQTFIKTNKNREITGAIHQDVLRDFAESVLFRDQLGQSNGPADHDAVATALAGKVDVDAIGVSVAAFEGTLSGSDVTTLGLGIVADGVTNVTAGLNALADRSGRETFFFPDGDYYIDDTITWDSPTHSFVFAENARLLWNGASDRPAVVWGQNTTSSNLQALWGFQIRNDTAFAFSDDDFTGLRIINVRYTHSWIKYIEGFTNGFQLYGSTTGGTAYNIFSLGLINACKRHIDFVTVVANGFLNDNLFLKGRSANVGYPTDEDSYGVTFRSSDGTNNYGHNNNTFLAHTFELRDGDVGVERIPVDIDGNGNHNRFLSTRVEEGRGPYMRVDGSGSVTCHNNVFEIGLTAGGVFTGLEVIGANAYNNRLTVAYGQPFANRHIDVVHEAWVPDATELQIAGFQWIDSNGVITRTANAGVAELGYDYVRIGSSQGIAFEVDASVNKHFNFTVSGFGGDFGRCHVAVYDSSGTRLASTDTGYPHVISSGLTYAASSWGGPRYSTTSDASTQTITFSVTSHVAKVRLIWAGGTNRSRIRAINIEVSSFGATLLAPAITINPVGYGPQKFSRVVDETPANVLGQGFIEQGEIFPFSGGGSGQAQGWQCSATGISALAWAISTAYVIGQLRNNDTGKVYICTVAGTSASSGGPTGTGTGITDGTVTWDYTGHTLPTFAVLPSLA